MTETTGNTRVVVSLITPQGKAYYALTRATQLTILGAEANYVRVTPKPEGYFVAAKFEVPDDSVAGLVKAVINEVAAHDDVFIDEICISDIPAPTKGEQRGF